MKYTKGQTEILGLLMIVILLLVLGMIYLRFATLTQTQLNPSLRSNIETTNLLQALMNLHIGGPSIKEMSVSCSQDPSTCPAFEKLLTEALYANLDPSETFTFTLAGNEKELIAMKYCTRGIVTTFPFVKDGVYFDSALTICHKTTGK